MIYNLFFPIGTASVLFCSPVVPGSGNKPFTLFSQTHSFVGIENCFASIGDGNQRASKTSLRSHLKRLSSSVRWPMRITYGEQGGFGVNFSSWGSRYVNGPSRNTCRKQRNPHHRARHGLPL